MGFTWKITSGGRQDLVKKTLRLRRENLMTMRKGWSQEKLQLVASLQEVVSQWFAGCVSMFLCQRPCYSWHLLDLPGMLLEKFKDYDPCSQSYPGIILWEPIGCISYDSTCNLIRFELQHLRKDIRFDWWRMFCVFGLVDFGCLYTPCCWAFTFPHQ